MFYNAFTKGPYRVAGYHDPNDMRMMGVIFRPDNWAASTVYYRKDTDNYDVVIPTVFTGVYYRVKAPGLSGLTEPVWSSLADEETVDGTIIWEAVNYNLLPPAESITAVTYTCSDDLVITSYSHTATSCQFMIPLLTPTVEATGSFLITLRMTKNNAEQFDMTLKFMVGER